MSAIARRAQVARISAHHGQPSDEAARARPARASHAHAGVQQLERQRQDPAQARHSERAAPAKQLPRTTPPAHGTSTPTGAKIDHVRDTVHRKYGELVHQLDAIRRAQDAGDATQVTIHFARAQRLLRSIVQLGNQARIDMRTGDKHDDAARRAIGQDVVDAYKVANTIDAIMPDGRTV
jgi:hypothetical protein